jgi:hypothetical protein
MATCQNPVCPRPQRRFVTDRTARQFCGRNCSNAYHALHRVQSHALPETIVWACGGGVESSAIAMMICEGILPRPDLAVMMDDGYERQETMQYVRKELVPRLSAAGVTLHVVSSGDYGADLSCIDRNGMVRIPAFRRLQDGSVTMLRTWCNSEWKQKPCRRWVRSQGVSHSINWVGISFAERRRVRPRKGCYEITVYPLIEKRWTRAQCLYELGLHRWPLPPRSSCCMCPMQNDEQWAAMRSVPLDWARVIACESEIHHARPDTWLHKTCRPISDIIGGGAK